MPFIQNHQKCTYILPATADDVHKAVVIPPGGSRPVDAAHWDAIRKGNAVLDALLAGRYLTSHDTDPDTDVALRTIATADVPADLASDQDAVNEVAKRTTKSTEKTEIDLDEPAEGGKKARK